MRFSDQLIDDIREYKKTFRIEIVNRAAVIENLKFLYDCCVASEALLKTASYYSIGFYRDLDRYYQKHLEEEKGEIQILSSDLNYTGIDWKRSPNPIAMAMIGTQYYLIKHFHPVSLLGYMAVQEADPTPIEVVEQLEKVHGKKLFTFIRMHAIKDLEHREELIQVIDSVPSNQQAHIVFSAQSTLDYLAKAMGEIYGKR